MLLSFFIYLLVAFVISFFDLDNFKGLEVGYFLGWILRRYWNEKRM